MITRRSLFVGATASLICAPAIVRFASLMPVKALADRSRWLILWGGDLVTERGIWRQHWIDTANFILPRLETLETSKFARIPIEAILDDLAVAA